MLSRKTFFLIVILAASGCDIWKPPVPSDSEYDKGLVVMYPGSFNTTTEMLGFYDGIHNSGVGEAIEIVQWAAFLDHMIDPTGAQVRNDARAREEAARLVTYQQAHPDRPVTLLGYSAGCWFAVLTAERMPEGTSLDRVILMSASIEKSYDLTMALNHTKDGIVHFWSPKDQFTRNIGAEFNLGDSTKGDPAASFGFDIQDDRLTQIEWDPAWEQYGYYGDHADYLPLAGWIEQFVAPWVQPSPFVDASAAASAKP